MKNKYIIFAALLATVGLSSCDMEKYPYDAIEESQYMQKLSDYTSARVGLYSKFPQMTTGDYILTSEFQCDDFLASANYTNTYGSQYRWDFQPSDTYIENYWKEYYNIISRCNYYIDSYAKVEDGSVQMDEADVAVANAYVGEAYFIRAYCYFQLATQFCQPYDASTAESNMGLPLQLVYNPTSDASQYVGRSSLKATFDQILSDLNEATTRVDASLTVNTANQALVNYITQDVVTAFKSRLALYMKDYGTAITCATSLISSNQYPLISDATTFRDMWVHDMGSEVIWQIYMNKDAYGSPTGSSFWGQHQPDVTTQSMDFIPAQSLLDLYAANDIRFDAFYEPFVFNASSGASGDIYVFDKYPGNPDLQPEISTNDWYTNKSKPFRISEQYLIAAEAYCESNDVTNGASYLNQLRASRIAGYTNQNFAAASDLRTAIRNERRKELVGEGFRFVDLKRWGLGVDRGNSYQDANLVLQPGNAQTTALVREAGDYRFVWPIPKTEIDVNPQISNQQNPGY